MVHLCRDAENAFVEDVARMYLTRSREARAAFPSLKETTKEHFFMYLYLTRECVVINVEPAPPDGDGAEYDRVLRWNPPSALLSEYLETCETPENN